MLKTKKQYLLIFSSSIVLYLPKEWEAKAVKAKEDYEEAVREFEANGGSTANGGAAKKRGKGSKAPAKRSKKADSEEEDESE